jgi:flagellar biosynthesis protein FlhG
MGLANVDVLFGLAPRLTVKEVLETHSSLREIIVEGPAGISIIPAASGAPDLTDLKDAEAEWLQAKLNELMLEYDYVIIDAPAGIAVNMQRMVKMAQEALLVTTPEPTAVTDAYAVAKLFSTCRPQLTMRLVVNMISDFDAGERISTGFGEMAERFLNRKIETIAKLPFDPHVMQAVRRQQPYVLYYSKCPATYALKMLAMRLQDLRNAALNRPAGEMANSDWPALGGQVRE